jgi:chromosome segregation ATPase
MADEPENVTLRMLRQIDAKLDTLLERMLDLTARVASVEDQLVSIKTDISGLRSDFVRLEHRMRRFDLIEA